MEPKPDLEQELDISYRFSKLSNHLRMIRLQTPESSSSQLPESSSSQSPESSSSLSYHTCFGSHLLQPPTSSSSRLSLSSMYSLKIEEYFDILQETWFRIRDTLVDAEERETKKSIKDWLKEIRNLAYDIVDCLKEFEHKLKLKESRDVKLETTSFIESLLKEVTMKVDDIKSRFDQLIKQRIAYLRTKEDEDMTDESPQLGKHELTTYVFGRNADKNALIRLLIPSSEDDNNDGIVVIALVGMGGVGKTTLAALLFNDLRVQNNFSPCGWVHASEDFDLCSLMTSAIFSFTKQKCHLTQLSTLQELLSDKLSERKFFLVVDNVWNENNDYWETFMSPFRRNSAKGSTILITTRKRRVAEVIKPTVTYHLNPISDDDCWKVFMYHAGYEIYYNERLKDLYHFSSFFNEKISNEKKDIAKGIVRRCSGLPLAAKALGATLNGKNLNHWRDVLNNDLWNVHNFDTEVLVALKLSYNHLPMHLKYCFLYSSVYPKGYLFKQDELAQLWRAYDYLFFYNWRIPRRNLGFNECIRELWWSSFFQFVDQSMVQSMQLRYVSGSKIFIHDIMHDLAQYILMNEFNDASQLQTLHVSLLPLNFQRTLRCHACYEPRIGRTFLQCWYPKTQLHLGILHLNLEHLTILDLSCETGKGDEPLKFDSIVNLKYLRYLALRNRCIEAIPESISNLSSLQTMDIRGCLLLHGSRLPPTLVDLNSLDHLLTSLGVDVVIEMRRPIHLSRYEIKRDIDDIVTVELKHSARLEISGLGLIKNDSEAKELKLYNKAYPDTLQLIYNNHHGDNEEEVMENLKPHVNLKDLEVNGYNGEKFPSWFGDPSFTNLTKMRIYNCYSCICMTGIGQLPFLQSVDLENLNSLESIESGPFNSLEILKIRGRSFPYLPMYSIYSLKHLELDIENISALKLWLVYSDSYIEKVPKVFLGGNKEILLKRGFN